MKAKKITALLMAVMMTIVFVIHVSGDVYNEEYRDWPNFGFVTGVVESVVQNENYYTSQIKISTELSGAVINVFQSTFILGEFPKEGDTITAFYDMNRPMIMIYPPHYTATVIVNGEYGSVYVDRFHKTYGDNELLSADGKRRLNVTNPETKIVSQGGQDATDWDLDGRLLVVAYTLSSRSMPPVIFAPEKIIVMYETAVHPGPEYIGEGTIGFAPPIGDISSMDVNWYNIVVNGTGMPDITYHSYGDAKFPTHVPLRAIAEFMEPDIDIQWDNGQVTITGAWGNISFHVGSPIIFVNGQTVILSQPTFLLVDRTFVPLAFFRDVVGKANAYSIGGTVFIDNFERMQ